ncbi:hypothetical protein [Kitasatospora sp. NPDC056531]|uniref:hypothetical protein n=1 Tax=Kitasatospora sp. NPDC056531 TaxID=3345856 RepID=UPI0036A5D206
MTITVVQLAALPGEQRVHGTVGPVLPRWWEVRKYLCGYVVTGRDGVDPRTADGQPAA